jgi:hypothetical protein
MDIRKEDYVSVLITLCLLATWYVTLITFNHPVVSLFILWVGMIVLTLLYYLVYKKKQRDMKILKTRFVVSAIPAYSALLFYVFILVNGTVISSGFRLLPIGIIGTMLLLNATVVYWYSRRDNTR